MDIYCGHDLFIGEVHHWLIDSKEYISENSQYLSSLYKNQGSSNTGKENQKKQLRLDLWRIKQRINF
jgi:hypothetical protein